MKHLFQTFAKQEPWAGVTAHGKECAAEMKRILSSPKPHPKAWARKILANPESYSLRARELADSAINRTRIVRERVPGEDDE